MADAAEVVRVQVAVNGVAYDRRVEPRLLLVDFLRDDLRLAGTHIGCEEGLCGACTVEVAGETVKSCLMFAVQADGKSVVTIEGVAPAGGLHPVQEGLTAEMGVQCGYCTPGMVLSARALLQAHPAPTEEEIRQGMVGNICRCTGYQGIVKGIARAAEAMLTSGGRK